MFENQYGYQRGKSTSYPMIKLINFLSKAQNEDDFVIGNRKQFVSIKDCKSKSRVISKGVLQGSILGLSWYT